MAKPEFDIVIIAAAPRGSLPPRCAPRAKAPSIDKHKLGGDCLWYGRVPSRRSSSRPASPTDAPRRSRALAPAPPQPDPAPVMERVAGS